VEETEELGDAGRLGNLRDLGKLGDGGKMGRGEISIYGLYTFTEIGDR
jgi:hypothetical protein